MHENEDNGDGRHLSTHSEEDPLQHLAVVVGVLLGVKPEDVVLVVVLREVKDNRGGLKYAKVTTGVVDERRDAAVWVQLDEPWFLENGRSVYVRGLKRLR